MSMSMTGLGAGSHQQTVVALSMSGSDAALFLMGELLRNQGPGLMVVDGLGTRPATDFRLDFPTVWFQSELREGR